MCFPRINDFDPVMGSFAPSLCFNYPTLPECHMKSLNAPTPHPLTNIYLLDMRRFAKCPGTSSSARTRRIITVRNPISHFRTGKLTFANPINNVSGISCSVNEAETPQRTQLHLVTDLRNACRLDQLPDMAPGNELAQMRPQIAQ